MKQAKFTSEWLAEYEQRKFISQTSARPGAGLPATKPEPTVRHEPLGAKQGEKESTTRPVICYISFRTRLLDAENIRSAGKWITDQLRYTGTLVDDTLGDVDVRVYQHKVRTVKEEKTLLLIYTEPVPW